MRVRPQCSGADPVVRRSDRADLQSNVALPLAKRIGEPPNQLAAELTGELSTGSTAVFADVAASGPGFLEIVRTGSFEILVRPPSRVLMISSGWAARPIASPGIPAAFR